MLWVTLARFTVTPPASFAVFCSGFHDSADYQNNLKPPCVETLKIFHKRLDLVGGAVIAVYVESVGIATKAAVVTAQPSEQHHLLDGFWL
jgi:hypothetical protein